LIISHSHKFIFFAAGKTGTTSIEKLLQPHASPFELTPEEVGLFNKHIPPVCLRERVPADVFESYFKVAFVRNPWDWVVSRVSFSNRPRSRWSLARVKKQPQRISEREIRDSFGIHAPTFRGLDWVDSVYQHARLADRDGRLLVDYVGRFESLQEDFDAICDRIGLPRQALPHLNRTRHRRYTEYYDDETRQLVAQKYSRDIRVFGYDFEGLVTDREIVRTPPFPR